MPGYYWPSPPNAPFMNKNVTGLAATDRYIYSNAVAGETELARAWMPLCAIGVAIEIAFAQLWPGPAAMFDG